MPQSKTPRATDAGITSPSARSASIVLSLLAATALILPMISVMVEANGAEDAAALRNDADNDGVVDTADVDDDNDGIPDTLEMAANGAERDTDADGMPDRLDLDSDNDGLVDWQESGVVFSIDLAPLGNLGGRLVGEVGRNGMLDQLEAPVDSGRMRVEPLNSDAPADDLADWIDLDSDNDGLPDLVEAGIPADRDHDGNGRIDVVIGGVGGDGIADYLQINNDRSCCDFTGDGREDAVPVNSDGAGLPDYLDLDSDGDGVADILEVGGTDRDGDSRVDDFTDSSIEPDGFDDAYRLVPLQATDLNGNGLADQLDASVVGSPAMVSEAGETIAPAPLNNDPRQPEQQQEQEEPEANAQPVPGVTQIFATEPDNDQSVRTGLNASGCSIISGSRDIASLLLALVSITFLAWRRTLRLHARPAFSRQNNSQRE